MRSRYKITLEIKSEVKERLTAVNMYINGMKQEEVGKVLGRNRGFVGRAVKN